MKMPTNIYLTNMYMSKEDLCRGSSLNFRNLRRHIVTSNMHTQAESFSVRRPGHLDLNINRVYVTGFVDTVRGGWAPDNENVVLIQPHSP